MDHNWVFYHFKTGVPDSKAYLSQNLPNHDDAFEGLQGASAKSDVEHVGASLVSEVR